MEQKKQKYLKLYIWLTAGILLSMTAALMKTSNTFDFTQFFGQGEVYEFSESNLQASTPTCYYDANAGVCVAAEQVAKKTFPKLTTNRAWNYISLNISGLNRESADWTFVYYDKAKNKLGEQVNTMVNGDNLIPIIYTEKFQRIKIVIKDQAGETFYINSMQLKETDTGFSKSIFLSSLGSFFLGYLLLSACVWAVVHRKCYAIVEILQYAYILFGDYWGSRLAKNCKNKNTMRTLLFWFIFMLMLGMKATGIYTDAAYYKYGILFTTLAIVVIALLSWEKPLQYVRWTGVIPIAWLTLWTFACISDFMVSKFYKFTGYAMFFGVGFFIFVCNQIKKEKKIFQNMKLGLEWTFPVIMLYCIFFRQTRYGVLYNGAFWNREDMALYAVALLIVFLSELFNYVITEKKKYRNCIINIAGAALSAYFLYRTRVWFCILIAIAAVILWIILFLKQRERIFLKSGKTIAIFVLSIAAASGSVLLVHEATRVIPQNLGTNITFEDELLETNWDDETIAETELQYPGTFYGVHQTADTDDRLIWKDHLRKINLFGNSDEIGAYNGWIEIIYRYGLFIMIPYWILIFACCYHALTEGDYFVIASNLAFFAIIFLQNIEFPFSQPLWIMFYLGMGIWFKPKERGKEE